MAATLRDLDQQSLPLKFLEVNASGLRNDVVAPGVRDNRELGVRFLDRLDFNHGEDS